MAFFAGKHAARASSERGGIHPDDRKDLLQHAPIEAFRATSVNVHLSQSLGVPPVALVAKDDLVRRGQLIASDSAGGMPVHAPISGTVVRVDKAPHPSQVVGEAIVIQATDVPDGHLEFTEDARWRRPADGHGIVKTPAAVQGMCEKSGQKWKVGAGETAAESLVPPCAGFRDSGSA